MQGDQWLKKPIVLGADGKIPSEFLPSMITIEDVNAAVAGLVNSAPSTLDTLNELAAALGNDANYAATISAALANRITKPSSPTTGHYLKWDGTNWVAAGVAAGGGGTKVWKTATETVTASTVLQDDNELFFTVLPNKTYRIKLNFVYEDSGFNDIKATLIVPSFAAPVSATNVDVMLLNIMSFLTLRTANSDITVVSGVTNGSFSGEYYLHVGSVGGQVIFRWAQSSASGTGKVYAGSFIEYEQLD